MTDREAEQLLELLNKYVCDYSDFGSDDIRISELADDLAMSMEVTSDRADFLRRNISENVSSL